MKRFFLFLLFAGLVAAAVFIWRQQSEESGGVAAEWKKPKRRTPAVGE